MPSKNTAESEENLGFDVPTSSGGEQARQPNSPAPAPAQDSPTPPQKPQDTPKQPESSASELPADFGACLKLLKEAQELPEASRVEFEKKQARIRQLTEHVHKIQQGDTSGRDVDFAAVRKLTDLQTENALRIRLQEIARTHPEVRGVLAENEELKAEIEKLRKKK